MHIVYSSIRSSQRKRKFQKAQKERLAYSIEDGRPALVGDALEDCEHGKSDVVEIDDAVEGSVPATAALDRDVRVLRRRTRETLALCRARYVERIVRFPYVYAKHTMQ